MNTALYYLYRDASNYKRYGSMVFRGEITPDEEAQFKANLDDGEYFIAEQVGLPNLREQWGTHFEDDHIWHEFQNFELVPERDLERLPEGGDVHEFVKRFSTTVWDEDAAMRRLADWVAHTPQGE